MDIKPVVGYFMVYQDLVERKLGKRGRTEGSALDRGYSGLTMGIEAFIYNYLQHLPVRCQGPTPSTCYVILSDKMGGVH